MGVLAVLCVEDNLTNKIIAANLKRQGWVLHQSQTADDAISTVREEGATLLIVANNSILPMSSDTLRAELDRDPGEGKVKVINLDVRSPLPPSIFGNPKGHLPPAIAVRPLDWLDRKLNLK